MPTVTALWLADRTCNIRNNSRRWRQCRLGWVGRSVGRSAVVSRSTRRVFRHLAVPSSEVLRCLLCVYVFTLTWPVSHSSRGEFGESIRWQILRIITLYHHHTHIHFAQSNWVLNAVCREFVWQGKEERLSKQNPQKKESNGGWEIPPRGGTVPRQSNLTNCAAIDFGTSFRWIVGRNGR